ncbi:MAG: DUF563 domain-containing protein [Limimaricola sp.]|uniref:glycosyltransferase 61 family protein n=1 Tax=Limimaricola sp. TaxID=2211665 RepID=UPI001D31DE9B|nr:glycosyltransferase family 61 protein [Limimaricola sp.]MBI1416623.1 DUF563 domain-containing protein [Limimaricola sp.]
MNENASPVVPDLTDSIAGRIELVENAIVVPPPKNDANRSVQNSGVLAADGRFVENSITWRGRAQVTRAPAMPDPQSVVEMSGNYMFLGPLFGHFGHFLVESICRIWAYGELRGKIDGAVWVPKFQNRPEHVLNVYTPFLNALGVDCPLYNLSDPTRIERLYVPQQGFGMFQMIEGAPEFREFVRANAGKNIVPKGAKKIYVSRSALPAIRGSILGETLLESYLQDEGYEVFHPQKYNHADQIAAYKAATHIIAVDCSPLHLLALVGNADQKVGIIARRAGDLDQIFAQQLRAFQGSDAHPFNYLRRNWIEEHANRPSRTSWGEIAFDSLYEGLRAAGLIEGTKAWPALTEAQITEFATKAGEGAKTTFRPYEGDTAAIVEEGD